MAGLGADVAGIVTVRTAVDRREIVTGISVLLQKILLLLGKLFHMEHILRRSGRGTVRLKKLAARLLEGKMDDLSLQLFNLRDFFVNGCCALIKDPLILHACTVIFFHDIAILAC